MRPKTTTPSTTNRETNVVERIFQALLGVVIVGAIYRYCWLGSPIFAQTLPELYANKLSSSQISQTPTNAAPSSIKVSGWTQEHDGALETPSRIGSLQDASCTNTRRRTYRNAFVGGDWCSLAILQRGRSSGLSQRKWTTTGRKRR